MCDINVLKQKANEMDDYLSYVNTDVDRKMGLPFEVYVAYAAHEGKTIAEIGTWYSEAEKYYVSQYSPDYYLAKKYDVWSDDELNYYYEKEVHRDGTLYECGGYFFYRD